MNKLTDNEIRDYFNEAGFFKPDRFHWFNWHFTKMRPLALDIIVTLKLLDLRAPGCAKKIIFRLGELGGKEKYEPHYEQLIQILSELVIARRLCEVFDATSGFQLIWEPTGKTDKNPEFVLCEPKYDLLVEVKCPSLLKHMRQASQNDVQLLARIGETSVFDQMASSGSATKPVDNRIKDFLISAEGKFATFDREIKPCYSLLVICWEQRMFEAVSPIINEMSGLFTARSFYKNADHEPIKFPNIDGILVTPHMAWLIACTREEECPGIYASALDYGEFGAGVPVSDPAFIANPHSSRKLPAEMIDALYGVSPDPAGDPMTAPLDMVFWLPSRTKQK